MTPSTPVAQQRPAPGPALPPTHACVRCGAQVALDAALCEACNPLGLSQPATSQVHGTAFLGVGLAVVMLAFVARLSLSGIGPFDGQVANVQAVGDGLAVTLTVGNQGESAGQATCRVTDPAARFGGASAFVLTPRIDPGATLTFETEIRQLGGVVRALVVECTGP